MRISPAVFFALAAVGISSGAAAAQAQPRTPAISNAPAPEVAVTIGRAVEAYGKVRTARGTLEQTITNPLTRSVMTSKGTFQQRLPNELAVRFTDPAGDVIIADGKVIWVYLPSTNPGQVIKLPVDMPGASQLDLTRRFLDKPMEQYTITPAGNAMIDGRRATAVTLVPRTPMPEFNRAIVWIDDADGLIRQFETTEASGLVRRIRFDTLRVNSGVDANAFTFVPPSNVRVIDHTGSSGR
jgi:outer membrane lipoprotein carrier protein